jgi:putative SOS response-associated peptidase YedK
MCGRFIQITDPEKIKVSITDLEIDGAVHEKFKKHYNIGPSQEVLTVLNTNPPRLTFTQCGLIPYWAKDKKIGYKMINARAETLTSKPSYKEPFKKRRCIVFADGFFEWKRVDKSKAPYFIHMKSREPFAIASLWDYWTDKETGESINSSTIITTDANPLVAEFHDRMPVILEPDAYKVWLSSAPVPEQTLLNCLHGYPQEKMEAYEVSKLVNNVQNDSPEIIRPV